MERSSETIVCSKTKTAHELRDLGQGNSDNQLETITLLVTKPAYGLPLENYDQAKMERDSVSPLVLQDQEYFAYSWFRKLILLILSDIPRSGSDYHSDFPRGGCFERPEGCWSWPSDRIFGVARHQSRNHLDLLSHWNFVL